MTASDQWPEPLKRRLGLPMLSATSEALRDAAHEREREFAAAMLRASTGVEVDVDELLDLGARCGLAPYRVFIALRAAEEAHKAWQASVQQAAFPHYS